MARVIGLPHNLGTAGGVLSQVKVLGVSEAIAKLAAVDAKVKFELGALMYQTARSMGARAKENCPVITGNLKSSIKVQKAGPYSWEVSASSLDGTDPGGDGKNTYEYADFVEFGTSKMFGRHFMEQAYHDVLPVAQAGVAAIAARIELL